MCDTAVPLRLIVWAGCVSWVSVATSTISGPIVHDDGYDLEDTLPRGRTLELLIKLNWTDMAVISDEESVVNWLVARLTLKSIQLELKSLPPLLEGAHNGSAPDMVDVWNTVKSDNILIAGSQQLQVETLKQMALLSTHSPRMSRLVLDTHWLLLVSGQVMDTAVNVMSLPVINLAFIVHDSNSTLKAMALEMTEVKTLVWASGTVRVTAAVEVIRVQGIDSFKSVLYPNFQHGLTGRPLRVGILPGIQYVIGHYSKPTNKTTYTGLYVDLLDILAQSLNFTYELVVPPDGQYGDIREGKWTGLVGLLHKQEVDFVCMPMTPTPERGAVADWTSPLSFSSMNVLARNDDLDFYLWKTFVTPFTWQVYMCAAVTFVGCVLMLLSLNRLSKTYTQHINVTATLKHAETRSDVSLHVNRSDTVHDQHDPLRCLNIVEYLTGCPLGESTPEDWVHGSSRALIACWFLLSLVLTSCYTSKLTSLLVTVSSPAPFTSLAGMMERGDFRWGVVGGTSNVMELRRSQDPVHKMVYKKMMKFSEDDPDILSIDPEVHLSRVRQGHYAYFGSSPEFQRSAKELCDVTLLPAGIGGLQFFNLFTPKQSGLTSRVDKIILRLKDTGVMSYLDSKWTQTSDGCHGDKSSTQSITLAALQDPFYVAGAGLLVASVVVILEKLFFVYRIENFGMKSSSCNRCVTLNRV